MTEDHLTALSGGELNRLLRHKQVKAVEITEAFLARINRLNPLLNAFITVSTDTAMEQARSVDQMVQRGEPLSVVAGLPIAVKDNISTRGIRTTCAARILDSYIPPFDATAIERLRANGAIVIGKTNLDQFG